MTLKDAMMCIKIRKPTDHELKTCAVIDLVCDVPWHPDLINEEEITSDDYEKLVSNYEQRDINLKRTKPIEEDWKAVRKYLLYPSEEVTRKTLQNTTRYASINMRIPMRQHYRVRNPILQRRRINEPYSTDSWFSTVTSFEGYNVCQAFTANKSKVVSQYGMKSEGQGPDALLDFFRQEGVPISITRDNSKMQAGKLWTQYCRNYWVKDQFIEPHHPNQNPTERMMAHTKEKIQRLLIRTGAPPEAWYRAACHVADVHNHTANETLNFRTLIEVRDGETPDISGFLQFEFWDPVYCRSANSSFPIKGGNEKLSRWCGRAQNYGDKMCYWIYTDDTHELIIRSMVRPVKQSERLNAGFTMEETGIKKTPQSNAEKLKSPIIDIWKDPNPSKGPLKISNEMVLKGQTKIRGRHVPLEINPSDLIDMYVYDLYKTKKGNERTMKGQVKEQLNDKKFRVAFENGKQKVYEFEELIAILNREDEEDVERWSFQDILSHRRSKDKKRKGKMDLLIKWEEFDEPCWEPMEIFKKDDPVTLARYARDHNLLAGSAWKWANRYVKPLRNFLNMIRQILLKRKKRKVKFQYGFKVPRNVNEAYKFDNENGDTKWADAIQKEVNLLKDEYHCFDIKRKGKAPQKVTDKFPFYGPLQ
jgi:hypothetical protein